MFSPMARCSCYYCQRLTAARWRRAGLLLLAVVALLSTGVVFAGEGKPFPAPWYAPLIGFGTVILVGVLLFAIDDLLRPRRGRRK